MLLRVGWFSRRDLHVAAHGVEIPNRDDPVLVDGSAPGSIQLEEHDVSRPSQRGPQFATGAQPKFEVGVAGFDLPGFGMEVEMNDEIAGGAREDRTGVRGPADRTAEPE